MITLDILEPKNLVIRVLNIFNKTSKSIREIEDIIEIAQTDKVYIHKTLVSKVINTLSDVVLNIESVDNNTTFNVLMCIGEEIDKVETEKNNKLSTLYVDVITKVFLSDIYGNIVNSGIVEKIPGLLVNCKRKQTPENKTMIQEAFNQYKTLLHYLSSVFNGLANIMDNEAIMDRTKDDIIFKAIDSSMTKLLEHQDHVV